MPPRLSDTYKPGDLVEILLTTQDGTSIWLPAQVIGFQRPGCWVQTADGHQWFVTNTSRIRTLDSPGSREE
jgi:hypothetical protein